jgi:hypothetical protein
VTWSNRFWSPKIDFLTTSWTIFNQLWPIATFSQAFTTNFYQFWLFFEQFLQYPTRFDHFLIFDQFWPVLNTFDQFSTNFKHIFDHSLPRCRPILMSSDPFRPVWVITNFLISLNHFSTDFDHFWPIFNTCWPTLDYFEPIFTQTILTNFEKFQISFWQFFWTILTIFNILYDLLLTQSDRFWPIMIDF